ncbi:MAG: hypothetical protein HYZ51_02200 [Candidatus Doudnabacteria bacterium]|nr:hypothetical protein [Candidatus Doudnabacteria bacterium]
MKRIEQFGFLQEQNPERKSRIRKVVDLAQKGVEEIPERKFFGYLGVSLEQIEELVETGKLPNFGTKGGKEEAYMYFIVVPTDSYLQSQKKDVSRGYNAVGSAKKIAKVEAVAAYAAKILQLDPHNSNIFLALDCLQWRRKDFREEALWDLAQFQKGAREVEGAIKLAQGSCEGLVVALNRKISSHVEHLDEETIKMVNSPYEGIDISFLGGLQALGKRERAYLNALREKSAG